MFKSQISTNGGNTWSDMPEPTEPIRPKELEPFGILWDPVNKWYASVSRIDGEIIHANSMKDGKSLSVGWPLEPVRITPEVLTSFGFKQAGRRKFSLANTTVECLGECPCDTFITVDISDEQAHSFSVNYLHQLQTMCIRAFGFACPITLKKGIEAFRTPENDNGRSEE